MNPPRAHAEPAIDADAVVNALGGFAVLLDSDFRVLSVAGTEAEGLRSKLLEPCHRVIRGRVSVCPRCPAKRAMDSGLPVEGREAPLAGEGPPVPVLAVPTGTGNTVLLVSALRPGDRRQPSPAEHERACATLFEEAPCYIVVIDEDFRILRTNRKVREDFGGPPAGGEIACYQLFKRRGEPCLECPAARVFRDGEPHTSRETVITAEGTAREVLIRSTPLLDAEGQVSRVLELATDITEIQEVKGQLESLGMLVGRIAHEVKGVLTGLDGGVYMVSTGLEKNDEKRVETGWGMVRRNVDRIRTLIMDMLYYAKDRQPVRKLAAPARILCTVADRFRNRLEASGVELQVDVDPAAVKFWVDVRAIEALLTNLIENAVDACTSRPEDATPRRIRLSVTRRGDTVRYTVADNGVGMDEEARAKALTPFFGAPALLVSGGRWKR